MLSDPNETSKRSVHMQLYCTLTLHIFVLNITVSDVKLRKNNIEISAFSLQFRNVRKFHFYQRIDLTNRPVFSFLVTLLFLVK